MGAFTYDSLNHEKHEVRLLEIIPSILNGPIRCRLIHYSLEKTLSYEAISYAWLLPFEKPQSLKPDYTIIDYKVYRNVVLAALRKAPPKFLCYCQPHLQTQIPSWMPDWSKPRLTPMLQDGLFMSYYELYNASGSPLQIIIAAKTVLKYDF